MQIAKKTDKGIVRSMNQDACAAGSFSNKCAWGVVCDGMGGAPAGDFAAKTAVDIISERIKNAFREDMSAISAQNLLLTAITAAGIVIYDDSIENRSRFGMGTTVVACIVLNDVVVCAFVGDSRAYLVGKTWIERITHDHSLVQEKIDAGQLSEEEAQYDPDRHIITRVLGVSDTVKVEFSTRPIYQGDRLLLCTDGLTNLVREDEIKQILLSNDTNDAAELLIEKANNAGGRDNITAVVIAK